MDDLIPPQLCERIGLTNDADFEKKQKFGGLFHYCCKLVKEKGFGTNDLPPAMKSWINDAVIQLLPQHLLQYFLTCILDQKDINAISLIHAFGLNQHQTPEIVSKPASKNSSPATAFDSICIDDSLIIPTKHESTVTTEPPLQNVTDSLQVEVQRQTNTLVQPNYTSSTLRLDDSDDNKSTDEYTCAFCNKVIGWQEYLQNHAYACKSSLKRSIDTETQESSETPAKKARNYSENNIQSIENGQSISVLPPLEPKLDIALPTSMSLPTMTSPSITANNSHFSVFPGNLDQGRQMQSSIDSGGKFPVILKKDPLNEPNRGRFNMGNEGRCPCNCTYIRDQMPDECIYNRSSCKIYHKLRSHLKNVHNCRVDGSIHTNMVNGNFPLGCEVDGCLMRFPTTSKLHQHNKKYHDIMTCGVCTHTSHSAAEFQRHRVTEHPWLIGLTTSAIEAYKSYQNGLV